MVMVMVMVMVVVWWWWWCDGATLERGSVDVLMCVDKFVRASSTLCWCC